ncbi:MAG: hypothetical protein EOP10_29200 [Proteobacteria bacterium]|nr:MAG: hypothetical protein EOP10_29200 [Pseudomonadota bacterium]
MIQHFSKFSSIMTQVAASVFVTLFSLVSLAAHADQAGPDYRDLSTRLQKRTSGLRSEILYVHANPQTKLDNDHLQAFAGVAKEQAKIWADTILEGDYSAAGDTRLDQVEAVFEQASGAEQLIAYRIIYSEKAWYTADCDPRRGKDLCEEGRIEEASFVSPTTESWMRDDSAYADFNSGI